MKKLIIIPAYNESENILNTIKCIEKDAPDFDYVVINDCSKDNTLEILENNQFCESSSKFRDWRGCADRLSVCIRKWI